MSAEIPDTIHAEMDNALIGSLQSLLRDAEEKIISLTRTIEETKRFHEEDIQTIALHLVRAAREYEWCSAYDNRLDELNEKLHIKLPPRQKQFLITGKLTVDIRAFAKLDLDADEDQARTWLFDMEYRDVLNEAQFYSREFSDVEFREIES